MPDATTTSSTTTTAPDESAAPGARPRTTDAAAGLEPGRATAGYEPAATQQQVVARRTILQQTLRDTFRRPTARAGLVWVCVLATVGVFAPFLASSDPLLVKDSAARVFSPLLRDLRPGDVILAALYVVAVALVVWRRFSVARSVAVTRLRRSTALATAWTL